MNETKMNINWFPGHMKKTEGLIKDNLKLVDIVIELVDARIPLASKNPLIDEITKGKPRLIVFNKSDYFYIPEILVPLYVIFNVS